MIESYLKYLYFIKIIVFKQEDTDKSKKLLVKCNYHGMPVFRHLVWIYSYLIPGNLKYKGIKQTDILFNRSIKIWNKFLQWFYDLFTYFT